MTLGFLFGSKNLWKLLSVSWEVFVLHGYDWIQWVAKSCTTTAYRWLFRDSHPSLTIFVIGCTQITKIFCTRFDSTYTSSARSLCDLGPLAELAISVFREVSKNTLFTQILTSRRRGLSRWFMRGTGVWVSAFRKLCHPRDFLWILAAISACQNTISRFYRGFVLFGFGILVGLFNNSSDVSEVNGSPRSYLSTHLLDTAAV